MSVLASQALCLGLLAAVWGWLFRRDIAALFASRNRCADCGGPAGRAPFSPDGSRQTCERCYHRSPLLRRW